MASVPSDTSLNDIPDGGTIVASDHRNNYSSIQSALNSVLGILRGGTAGQVLGSSGGSTVAWQNGTTTYRKTTSKAVNTTTTATDLLNGEITIAAGIMGATGALRIHAWGDWLNNSGGTVNFPKLQLIFGGSTFFDMATSSIAPNSASRGPWDAEFVILNSAAAVQITQADVSIWLPGSTPFTSGYASAGATTAATLAGGAANSATVVRQVGNGTGAVDTASAQALLLKATNGSASASCETRLLGAIIEVV